LNTSPEPEPAVSDGIRPLADIERDHIRAALSATGWNKKETARLLQISRETLYRKIRTFQLTDRGESHP
jgi:two-component system response regulator HydG